MIQLSTKSSCLAGQQELLRRYRCVLLRAHFVPQGVWWMMSVTVWLLMSAISLLSHFTTFILRLEDHLESPMSTAIAMHAKDPLKYIVTLQHPLQLLKTNKSF